MAGTVLRTTENGAIAVLTFHRPEKLNALNTPTLVGLVEELDAIEGDDDVRVVILRGAGDKAFVAGADIAEYAEEGGDPDAFEAFQRRGRAVNDRLASFPKPVIAAVNGYALGGGFELALCCDIIIASESARFGLPEGLLGLSPGGGGTQRLVRAVGPFVASEVLLGAKRLHADRAYQLGLIAQIVPSDALLETALEWAASLLRVAPLAARAMKTLLRAGADAALPTALNLEQEVLLRLFRTDDGQEGIRAFIEKRPPNFTGR